MADNALMRYSAPDGMFPPNALAPRQPELRAYDEPWYRAVPNALSEWMGLGPSGREIMRNALGPSNPLNIPAQAQEAGREIGGGLATGDYARAGMGGLGLAMAIGPGPRFFPRGVRAPAETPNVVPQGIRAYHGSPHDFDKFDMSKIGTGEGAQAFGHGLYFAESELVARSYRNKLTSDYRIGGNPIDVGDPEHMAAYALHVNGGDREAARNALRAQAANSRIDSFVDRMSEAAHLAGNRAWTPPKVEGGRVYEVNINARPEDFLDWDKPLSAQSEKVRETFKSITGRETASPVATKAYTDELYDALFGNGPTKLSKEPFDPTGEAAYKLYGVGKPNTTQALREAGIPGIRYKDAMSRGAEGGTSNYVVFDSNLISILRKYGLLPPAAAGAAAMTSQPNQEQ